MGRRGAGGGFTLLEVLAATTVFSIVLIAVGATFLMGTNAYRDSVKMAHMRLLTQRALMDMRTDLMDCHLLDGSNLLDAINFQRPTPKRNLLGDVHYINTADYQANVNNPYWGDGETEVEGSGETHVGNTIRLAFVPAALLDEAMDGVDYNRDGDRADRYERGRIRRSVFTSGGALVTERDLTQDWVVRPALPRPVPPELDPATELPLLDVDGMGGPDPVFLILDDDGAADGAGGRIQVRLFFLEMLNRLPVLMCAETVLTPVNK